MKRAFFSILLLIPVVATLRAEDTVIQIPVDSVLNTRCVATLSDGRFVPWQMGVDRGGEGSGFLTLSAALSVGNREPHALPDVGRFAADARHPEIVLHYSNADGASNQVRSVKGVGSFSLPIPTANYTRLFLFFTSSEGASALSFLLTYADTTTETVAVQCPDYFADVRPDDPAVFCVVQDLAKWGKDGKMRERGHHNIDGIELHPAAEKSLVSVTVSKTNERSYLVFWGATGVADSAAK